MNDIPTSEDPAFDIRLERERQMANHAMMGPVFDQTQKLVIDLIERQKDVPSAIKPIDFRAVNTDAQALFLDENSPENNQN